jgi:DNA-directed RNA polymerase beta' subunit
LKCFYCDKEINIEKERYIIKAYDIPYVNLYFHKDTCYREIKDKLIDYINKNSDRALILAGSSNRVESIKPIKGDSTKVKAVKVKQMKVKRKLGR